MQTDRTAAGDGDDRSRAVIAHSPAQFGVRTLRALEVLAFTPTTAPRLAAELGVHQRTARRLLRQLRQDGWVSYTREPPHVYAPTLRLVALAAHIGGRAPLATLTAPAVEQLHAVTGLPATLAIPAYDATVCLVRSCGDLAGGPLLTLPEPAHCTAAGKVLMAHREPWCRSILALPLVGCTERTVPIRGCSSVSSSGFGSLAAPSPTASTLRACAKSRLRSSDRTATCSRRSQ